ncbi:unnamed protein product, partial [Mycena citricolor]
YPFHPWSGRGQPLSPLGELRYDLAAPCQSCHVPATTVSSGSRRRAAGQRRTPLPSVSLSEPSLKIFSSDLVSEYQLAGAYMPTYLCCAACALLSIGLLMSRHRLSQDTMGAEIPPLLSDMLSLSHVPVCVTV